MPAIRLAGPTTSSVKRAAVMTCFLTSFICSPFISSSVARKDYHARAIMDMAIFRLVVLASTWA